MLLQFLRRLACDRKSLASQLIVLQLIASQSMITATFSLVWRRNSHPSIINERICLIGSTSGQYAESASVRIALKALLSLT